MQTHPLAESSGRLSERQRSRGKPEKLARQQPAGNRPPGIRLRRGLRAPVHHSVLQTWFLGKKQNLSWDGSNQSHWKGHGDKEAIRYGHRCTDLPSPTCVPSFIHFLTCEYTPLFSHSMRLRAGDLISVRFRCGSSFRDNGGLQVLNKSLWGKTTWPAALAEFCRVNTPHHDPFQGTSMMSLKKRLKKKKGKSYCLEMFHGLETWEPKR